MKRIEAIFRHQRLAIVRERLYELGVRGFHYHDIVGTAHSRGGQQGFRGRLYQNDPLPRVKLTIITEDERAEEIANEIVEAARQNRTGDGKVFISEVEEVIRVRTGERGMAALEPSHTVIEDS